MVRRTTSETRFPVLPLPVLKIALHRRDALEGLDRDCGRAESRGRGRGVAEAVAVQRRAIALVQRVEALIAAEAVLPRHRVAACMYSGNGGVVIAREARERAGVLDVGEADGVRPAARLLARLEVRGGVTAASMLAACGSR